MACSSLLVAAARSPMLTLSTASAGWASALVIPAHQREECMCFGGPAGPVLVSATEPGQLYVASATHHRCHQQRASSLSRGS
eukprot:6498154-Pyramimonas_sp.AAC.1